MHRSVESHITILHCIPAGMHPSMNLLSRFAAHQPTMDGMHSAGMQPEGGGRFSTERRIPPGCHVAGAFLRIRHWRGAERRSHPAPRAAFLFSGGGRVKRFASVQNPGLLCTCR
jgi:hypothetical protein